MERVGMLGIGMLGVGMLGVGMPGARIWNGIPEVVEQLGFRPKRNADHARQPVVPPVEFDAAAQLGFHTRLDDARSEASLRLRLRRRAAAFDPPELKLVVVRFPADLNAA